MHVLVTGGAGFIGSHLVTHLVEGGHRVRVLDDLSTGHRSNLEHLPADAPVEVQIGSIVDLDTCRAAVEGVEGVLHQAALPSVPRSVENPLESNAINIDGTLNLLVAARDAGARRFVMASSSSVYGNTPELPKHEGMPPNPRSPYALNKYTAETYTRLFHELYGLETVALRYFNIFGPRQDPQSAYAAVIPRFVTALREGRAPEVHGDGLQTRDFTYVDNAVQANLKALTAPDAPGGAYNVAGGKRVSLMDLLVLLNERLGTSIEAKHVEARTGDVRDSLADLTLSREKLGFDPQIDLAEGLSRYLAWFEGQ